MTILLPELQRRVTVLGTVLTELDSICQAIRNTQPHDNPQRYKTVEEFENAWAVHFGWIEKHQHLMNKYDQAIIAIEDELREVKPPMPDF